MWALRRPSVPEGTSRKVSGGRKGACVSTGSGSGREKGRASTINFRPVVARGMRSRRGCEGTKSRRLFVLFLSGEAGSWRTRKGKDDQQGGASLRLVL